MWRNILAVLAGVIVGGVVNMAIVLVSVALHPLPEGMDMTDSAAMRGYISSLPALAFVLAWLAHAGGTFAGSVVAALLSRSAKFACAMVIGFWFLVGGIVNLIQIPHPLAFAVIDLLSYIPAAMLGWWLVAGRSKGVAATDAT